MRCNLCGESVKNPFSLVDKNYSIRPDGICYLCQECFHLIYTHQQDKISDILAKKFKTKEVKQ